MFAIFTLFLITTLALVVEAQMPPGVYGICEGCYGGACEHCASNCAVTCQECNFRNQEPGPPYTWPYYNDCHECLFDMGFGPPMNDVCCGNPLECTSPFLGCWEECYGDKRKRSAHAVRQGRRNASEEAELRRAFKIKWGAFIK